MRKFYSFMFALVTCLTMNAQVITLRQITNAPLQSPIFHSENAVTVPEESFPAGYCSTSTAKVTGIALNDGKSHTFEAAIQLPVSKIKGNKIFGIKFFTTSTNVENVQVSIRTNLDEAAVCTQNVNNLIEGWNMVILDTPYDIPASGDIYLSYSFKAINNIAIGLEVGSLNSYADYLGVDSEWNHLYDLSDKSIKGAWCIQALATGGDYSAQKQYNVDLAIVKMKSYTLIDQSFGATCAILNNGVKTIRNMELTYKIGDNVQTVSLTNLAIINGNEYYFELPEQSLTPEGKYEVEVSINTVNGQANEIETLQKHAITALTPGTFVERNLLIEHFTGQFCQYCPYGRAAITEAIEENKDRVIWISHFSYDYGEKSANFALAEDYTLAKSFKVNGAPYCMLDRTYLPNVSSAGTPVFIPTGAINADLVEEMLEIPSYIDLNLNGVYDKESKAIKVTVSGKLLKEFPNAKLYVFLNEDNLIGFQYDNATQSVIRDQEHNHVNRGLISGSLNGDDLNITDNQFSQEYTYAIPEKIANTSTNPENMKVIAFVADYVQNAATKCNVHNSIQLDLKEFEEGYVSSIETTASTSFDIYAKDGKIQVDGLYDSIEVYTIDGKLITNKCLAKGIYIIKVNNGKQMVVKKIVLQ